MKETAKVSVVGVTIGQMAASRRLAACLTGLIGVTILNVGHGAALTYPVAERGPQVDDYHGVKIADPYRWMEDANSAAVKTWSAAESQLSSQYLAAIPGRARIAKRLREIVDFERWDAPEKHGQNWFYMHNSGLQGQSVLMVARSPDDKPRVLLDPNMLAHDGTIAVNERAISWDGALLAYALSDAGSDWQTWHVRDVATGKDLPDTLHWSKAGTASWRKDNSGFYYTAYDAPDQSQALQATNTFQKVYFHHLGTPQSQDVLVYTRAEDPDWFVGTQTTDDGRYLVLHSSHEDEVQNTLSVVDLSKPGASPTSLLAKPTAMYTFVGNVGPTFFVLTDDDAPRLRIVAIDLNNPAKDRWRTIVPESADTIDEATFVGGQVVVQYLKDDRSAVSRFATPGTKLGDVALQGMGMVSGLHGGADDRETYYSYSTWLQPPAVFRLDLDTGKSTVWRQSVSRKYDPSKYAATQVFFPSKDGTRIPMFIISRKDVKLDGSNPTILFGYGGYNISPRPQFGPEVSSWLEQGGVFAVATLRGGGEYGRSWHEAGMKTRKQNVFDDFIGAAQYLIANRWTQPQRLSIRGLSNGGLLVGVVLEQRPDLFVAAVAQAGVMDMLRFRNFTEGKGWESEFGSVDNPEEFSAILRYSPLHNVKQGVPYPWILVTTADHDDRVVPAHSFKFTAALQYANPTGNPILLRIDKRAGHGQGKPLQKQIDEIADRQAFVRKAMGLAHE